MDSKLLTRALLMVTLFVLIVFFVVLGVNGRLGGSKKTVIIEQDEDIQNSGAGPIAGSELRAWMNDDTFFDAEELGSGRYDTSVENALILSATSVQKDLRIKVLDSKGNLARGIGFTVEVSGVGKTKDLDKDGILYISDLEPGEYQIRLMETPGYEVPLSPLNCSVKSRIEYKAIKDISYLIFTEADIDALNEDTAVNDATEETLGNSAIRTEADAVFGIDVSKWNGEIDWKKVKKAGVEFAIIRCGYRGSKSGVIVKDPYFDANIQGALENGIKVGAYFFTQALTEVEAVEEASAALAIIGDYELDYPIFVDTEGAGGSGRADKLEPGDRTKACQAFCETIRNGGHAAGVYASKNWFNKRLDITGLSGDDVTWLAEYADKTSFGATYQIWQYSSAGRINGIEGRVDMNLSYLKLDD